MKEINNQISSYKSKFVNFFASQEFSRKICEWNVYFVTKVQPQEIPPFLSKNRILAGGSVLDLLRKKESKYWLQCGPNDYDIFFIKKNPSNFIQKIKKSHPYKESFNAITINGCVQFIKRLYENENRVVGGFDLDASRFYMNHLGEIYGTATAIASFKTRTIYINPCCQSRNFSARIYKYRRHKEFKIRHIHYNFNHGLFKSMHDYNDIYPHESEDTRKILIFLLSDNIDRCYTSGSLIPFKKLKSDLCMTYEENKGKNICYLLKGIVREKFSAQNLGIDDMINILRVQYEKYTKITNILLSNTCSQMTASFHPTNYSLKEMYTGIKFDIFEGHLRAIFQVIYFSKMPKVITYKIFRDYFDSYLVPQED
jgi:hypothetical protein